MFDDMFIKITGIEGESQDEKHKNEIDVTSWDWFISQNADMHSGSGGGSGKATITDLFFEHYVDRSSPNLMKYCLTGKHISEAVLVTRKAGGKPLDYLKITMTDVIVASVRPISGSNERVREMVGLSFSKIKQEYTLQNSQGGNGGVVTTAFDIKANKEL